jgi:hypothetical protein
MKWEYDHEYLFLISLHLIFVCIGYNSLDFEVCGLLPSNSRGELRENHDSFKIARNLAFFKTRYPSEFYSRSLPPHRCA